MSEIVFTDKQKDCILKIARESGENEIGNKKQQNYTALGEENGLTFVPGGVFVTYKIRGDLHGCIGCFSPGKPFYSLVQQYAIAACNDSRFRRMTPNEFEQTTISVSCLTVPIDITDPLNNVIAGKHGIVVEKGWCRGTYLPQVATEQGWDTKTFCTHCAHSKAGIDSSVDVLNDPSVHWQTYTATIVTE
ncbi:AMMECR1 domain-containing protein [Entamoeba marina]